MSLLTPAHASVKSKTSPVSIFSLQRFISQKLPYLKN